MDSLTQAALGAAIGEAILGKRIGHRGAMLGAVIATIPDLDVLLTPLMTPTQQISLHRGYSHSMLFCLLGGVLLAWMLKKSKWTKALPQGRLFLFTFLALTTHVYLDAFTTYGTQLFLPFSDYRVSFDSINIVDPFYTLPLLAGLLYTLLKSRRNLLERHRANTIGLVLSSAYLLFTLVNGQGIENTFRQSFESKGIPVEKILTVPVKIGNMNWYGVGRTTDSLYIGQYSRLDSHPIEYEVFPVNDRLLNGLDPYLIDRLKWFAQGFYVVTEKDGVIRLYNMQCDMQGVRSYGDYRAPTAFYYQIENLEDGIHLSSGMHRSE